MRVAVLQENLTRAMAVVGRAIDSRPHLPVLANVKLSANGDQRLYLVATNLETTVWMAIGANIEQGGEFTLPVKTFGELVAAFPPERVDLAVDEKTWAASIRCGSSRSTLKGISATEFPKVEPASEEHRVAFPGETFKQALARTLPASAKENSRPILCGLYFRFEGTTLTIAGADGYRLAVQQLVLETPFDTPVEFVVPRRSLDILVRVIDPDEELILCLPDEKDRVAFLSGAVTLQSQLLAGRFPYFGAIIPRTYSTEIVAYTTDLQKAAKRALIFARDSANSVRLVAKPPTGPGEPGEVAFVGKSAERGDIESLNDATVSGEALEASFNGQFLLDALAGIGQEQVVFQTNGPSHPGVLRPEGDDQFLWILMPMGVTR